jgi:hypothetical protein
MKNLISFITQFENIPEYRYMYRLPNAMVAMGFYKGGAGQNCSQATEKSCSLSVPHPSISDPFFC